MDVILTLLLCALGFFIYLADKNKDEVLRLKQERRDRDKINELMSAKIPTTYELADSAPVNVTSQSTTRFRSPSPPKVRQPSTQTFTRKQQPKPIRVDENTFVRVIFKKTSKKRYDYFLGENYDVQVGDFVVVYVNDKFSGETKWKIAQIVYISKPGEVSKHASSTVIKKADYPKW